MSAGNKHCAFFDMPRQSINHRLTGLVNADHIDGDTVVSEFQHHLVEGINPCNIPDMRRMYVEHHARGILFTEITRNLKCLRRGKNN